MMVMMMMIELETSVFPLSVKLQFSHNIVEILYMPLQI